MSDAQRKILAEMTRTAAADGHYDTADEFVQTRDPFPCDDCNGTDDVECVGGAYWCKPCRDAYAAVPPPSPAEDAAIFDYLDSHRDVHGNRL